MARTHQDCLNDLERIRWGNHPQCPYCGSTRATPIKTESRYHCNTCFTSYSVTVGTLFHKTHVGLHKWFVAIALVFTSTHRVSVRQLAGKINVNKNTAAFMLRRIHQASQEDSQRTILQSILKLQGFAIEPIVKGKSIK
jgi:transposase-like protein